jgi:pyrimidine operon attenuation protein/uracil phosphoribosyltransferase
MTLDDGEAPRVSAFAAGTGRVSSETRPVVAFRAYIPAMSKPTTLLDARAIDRTLRRIADEIVELNSGTDDLVVVGIERRGVQLADRIVALIEKQENATVARGALDITLYRDDLQTVGPRPVVGRTTLPLTLDGKRVVIVDDVLYTGRTIRAALDELADFGRPARIALVVLVDRGGRELPIHADIVGRTVDVPAGKRVDVLLSEVDDRDAVILADRDPA